VKKLITIGVVLALVFAGKSYLDAKMTESDKNRETAREFLEELCGRDSGCSNRMGWQFQPCFAGAYRTSPIPGNDRVNVTVMVDCMNSDTMRDLFVVGEGTPVPFPSE